MRKIILAILICASMSAVAGPSSAVYNITEEQWIHSRNLNQTRPIASLTKLMTVMVSMDQDQDLNGLIRLKTASKRFAPGTYTRRTMITAALVRSDNAAAQALGEAYPGGTREFVKAMNRKAAQLQMHNTRFTDASGLSTGNTATVPDVITMLRAADLYPIIREVSVLAEAEVKGRRNRQIVIHNTNQHVLVEYTGITVSKTGFTGAAGWCMALMVSKNNQRIAVVILGADSKQARLNQIQNHLEHDIPSTVPAAPPIEPQTPGDIIRRWLFWSGYTRSTPETL